MIKLFKRFKKTKPLDTRILKEYKNEAHARLAFYGTWSGYWHTVIDGIQYRSEYVTGWKYISYDYGNFITDAILDRVRLRRDKKNKDKTETYSIYGRERYVDKNGECEWW